MPHIRLKSLLLAIFVCCFSPVLVSAQDYRPGYIIKNNKDSVNGYIAYYADKKSTVFCAFKETRKGKPVKYFPKDLTAYGFHGDRQFLSLNLPDNKQAEKVFVKLLAQGVITLYRYDKLYLVRKDSLILLPLPKNEQIQTSIGTRVKSDSRYIGILNLLMHECQLNADNSAYKEDDLTNLINNFNRCKGLEPLYKKPRPIAKADYQIFGGYVKSNMELDLQDEVMINPSYTVVGGLGVDLSSPRIFDRVFFSIEAWYIKSLYQAYAEGPFNGDYLRQDITMDFSYLKVPIGFRYNFSKEYNTPYIKGGAALSFLLQSNIKILEETENNNGQIISKEYEGGSDLQKKPKGVWFSVGYDKTVFGNVRMFAEFRYEASEGFIGNPVQSYSKMKNYNFLLGVRF